MEYPSPGSPLSSPRPPPLLPPPPPPHVPSSSPRSPPPPLLPATSPPPPPIMIHVPTTMTNSLLQHVLPHTGRARVITAFSPGRERILEAVEAESCSFRKNALTIHSPAAGNRNRNVDHVRAGVDFSTTPGGTTTADRGGVPVPEGSSYNRGGTTRTTDATTPGWVEGPVAPCRPRSRTALASSTEQHSFDVPPSPSSSSFVDAASPEPALRVGFLCNPNGAEKKVRDFLDGAWYILRKTSKKAPSTAQAQAIVFFRVKSEETRRSCTGSGNREIRVAQEAEIVKFVFRPRIHHNFWTENAIEAVQRGVMERSEELLGYQSAVEALRRVGAESLPLRQETLQAVIRVFGGA